MVPMLTWGFFRSNFPRAARIVKRRSGAVVAVVGCRKRVVDKEGVNEEDRMTLVGFEEMGFESEVPEAYPNFVAAVDGTAAAEIDAMDGDSGEKRRGEWG